MPSDIHRCSQLEIVDSNGQVRLTIGMHKNDVAAVRLYNPQGQVVAELSQTGDGSGLLLADSDNENCSGTFLRVKSDGESQIGQFKDGGDLTFLQRSMPDLGSQQIHYDKNCKARLLLGVGELGWPELTILGSAGQNRITISDRGNDLCGIWLSNMRGTPRASMVLTSSSRVEMSVSSRTTKIASSKRPV